MSDMQKDMRVLEGKSVIIAEDDEVIQQQLEILMSRMGATVHIAVHSSELDQMFKNEGPYSLLLLDLHLPPYNMLEWVRNFRLEEKQMPILGLSATDPGGRAMNAGIQRVLKKPLDVQEIKRSIYFFARDQRSETEAERKSKVSR
ncbi:MAG: response regulator [Flavobacteriia bacterium]|nr:response regulator [Flavobacteriia bacterium]